MQRRQGMALILVITWLVFTAAAFWWFQFKDIRQFSVRNNQQTAWFQAGGLPDKITALQGNSAAITVVHFWDPGCGCSRFNNAHVADLIAEYGRKGVRFVVVPSTEDFDGQSPIELFGDDFVLANMNDMEMPASPAAAVINQNGELAYFGPYSSGADCGTRNGTYVEKVLDKLLEGAAPQYLNMAAVGCFCNWNNGG